MNSTQPHQREPTRSALTIMLVDDDEDEREVMRRLLARRVERVVCCDGGHSALQELRTGSPPDVIVLDLRMPGMNGWQFRVAQKRVAAWAAIPLIVVSGDHSAQAEAIDANAYITKPVRADSLLQAVETVVLDRERKRALARASERERLISLGALLGGIAHEINNPLAFIFGSIELLQRQLAAAALSNDAPESFSLSTASRALEHAMLGAERIATVVRSASMFASADLVSMEAIDLQEMLESCIQIASNEIRHGARLVRSFGDVPFVYGNPAKVGQVLLNLVLHAVHAIREDGGLNHVIKVATCREGTDAVVTVSDTAWSVDASARASIFEPGLSPEGGATRLQLGLAVSREIILEMNGTLDVVFAEPRGATFRVSLPAHARASCSHTPESPVSSTKVQAHKGSVLIVDDEPFMCELLSAALEDDFTVRAFTSPRAALSALARDTDFDAVLCDVMMPELNGIDLYEQTIASRPELSSRFVFITGGAFTDRARSFLSHATRPVLRKPCSRQELIEAITNVVPRSVIRD